MTKLQRIEVDGLKFDIRPDTSDEKAIREVVQRRNYARYHFLPAEGELWFDLGANVGAFSVWAASQHPSIHVEAFEPDPDMCELVDHNLKLNNLSKRVKINQAAVVSDDRKEVVLHCNVARGNVWRNSIERHWRGEEDVTVPALHINTILPGYFAEEYWVKMDIEGTEMPVLEWLTKKENTGLLPVGMVFEWSFDVDPSIARFHKIIKKLKKNYNFLKGDNLGKIDELDEWPPEAFPPCRLVYCSDPKA